MLLSSSEQLAGKGRGRFLHGSGAVQLAIHCIILPARRPSRLRLALTLTYPHAMRLRFIKLSYGLSGSVIFFYVIS